VQLLALGLVQRGQQIGLSLADPLPA
jgi:hypothetical protein